MDLSLQAAAPAGALSPTTPSSPCVYDTDRYAAFIRTRTMGRVRGLCLKDLAATK